jgi:hypothetical protein
MISYCARFFLQLFRYLLGRGIMPYIINYFCFDKMKNHIGRYCVFVNEHKQEKYVSRVGSIHLKSLKLFKTLFFIEFQLCFIFILIIFE